MDLKSLFEYSNILPVAKNPDIKESFMDDREQLQAIDNLKELQQGLRLINNKIRNLDVSSLKSYSNYSELYREIKSLVDHNNLISGHILLITKEI